MHSPPDMKMVHLPVRRFVVYRSGEFRLYRPSEEIGVHVKN